MDQIELLAPAKDVECAVAAIDCGADAVYIGAPKFGAREAAGNGLNEIAELVKYAHKFWAKVYITVNTLLYEEEIEQAIRLISELYDLGVDGLIIQDMGLLECDLPPIPLIASTQMHNNTPEKVAFLEKVGINRVILARELDIEQVREIRRSTSIELEYFVHGALCVCYSGQCYLSYALGGRSGNRGQCAQPCRKLYSLTDAKGKMVVSDKHLLSLRDLNLAEYLRELIEAGVCSFKIEGRLKDRSYVSNVVAYYRAKLDEALGEMGLGRSSSGASRVEFRPNVDKTFTRGYTTYFLHGRNEAIGSIDTPKMLGEAVGKVVSVSGQGAVIDSRAQLHNGDGICFFDRKGELRGSVVNGVKGRTIIPDKIDGIEKGTFIYRNHDHEFLAWVEKARVERLIEVRLKLRDSQSGFALIGVDEDGNEAEFAVECEKSIAQKPEQALDNMSKQLCKSGGTQFACVEVEVETEQVYFLPISTLNALRRGVLEELSAVREKNRPVRVGGCLKNDFPYPQKELSFTGNVLNSRAEAFYRRHGVSSIEPAAESGLDMKGQKVMTTRYCVKHQLGICPKMGKAPRYPEPLMLVDAEGRKLELKFDCAKCEMEVFLAGK